MPGVTGASSMAAITYGALFVNLHQRATSHLGGITRLLRRPLWQFVGGWDVRMRPLVVLGHNQSPSSLSSMRAGTAGPRRRRSRCHRRCSSCRPSVRRTAAGTQAQSGHCRCHRTRRRRRKCRRWDAWQSTLEVVGWLTWTRDVCSVTNMSRDDRNAKR